MRVVQWDEVGLNGVGLGLAGLSVAGLGWTGLGEVLFSDPFSDLFRQFFPKLFLFFRTFFSDRFFLLTVFKFYLYVCPCPLPCPLLLPPLLLILPLLPPPPPSCTTAVYRNDATYHNQRNLSQLVTQHVTIDANYHNSNAKCHNATAQLITKNFGFFCNMSQPDIERLRLRDILFEPGTF